MLQCEGSACQRPIGSPAQNNLPRPSAPIALVTATDCLQGKGSLVSARSLCPSGSQLLPAPTCSCEPQKSALPHVHWRVREPQDPPHSMCVAPAAQGRLSAAQGMIQAVLPPVFAQVRQGLRRGVARSMGLFPGNLPLLPPLAGHKERHTGAMHPRKARQLPPWVPPRTLGGCLVLSPPCSGAVLLRASKARVRGAHTSGNGHASCAP